MQDVNPNSWGTWERKTGEQSEGAYDMYPSAYGGHTQDTAPLTLRATKEEAAFKGWDLSEADETEAAHVAVAERVRWESSVRPLGSMVAQRALEL